MGHISFTSMVIAAFGFSASFACNAKSPDDNYRDKCSVCHDGGAGQAPRLQDKAAWAKRASNGRQALYQTALVGKPNTAMAAKGGYSELSDQEVRDIVDFMLKASGNAATTRQTKEQKPRPLNETSDAANLNSEPRLRPMTQGVLSDLELSKVVAERLRISLANAKASLDEYEGVVTVRGLGIKVHTHQGVTTLTGTLKESDHIGKAETIAGSTTGVQKVVNKLIAASVFEWD